jgi:hypothetical protein
MVTRRLLENRYCNICRMTTKHKVHLVSYQCTHCGVEQLPLKNLVEKVIVVEKHA